MRNAGLGPFGMPDDLDALARQYWSAWGEAMRNVAPGAASGAHAQPWQPSLDWWTALAKGGRHDSNDTLDRFNAQSQQWLGMMQQVASQFAGRDAGAADIANAWRQAMGGLGGMGGFNPLHGMGNQPFATGVGGFAGMPGAGLFGAGMGANPFASLMQGMQQGPGLHGFDQWFAQVSPWLQAMQANGAAMPQLPGMPQLPTFGFTRERDERWQQLAHAVSDLQQRMQAYAALMLQATQDAFAIFERKLAEHEEPGRQLASARALFDLWIDSAEEAYAPIALSAEFRTVYGELVDAQMRVRAGVQREVEHACEQVGMPTRSELDGAHRKIVELERQVRRLRDGAGATRQAGTRKAAAASASRSASVDAIAVPKAAAAQRIVAASAAAPAGAGQSVARPPTAKKPAASKSVAEKPAAKKQPTGAQTAKAAKAPAAKKAKVRKPAAKARPAKASAKRRAVVAKPSVSAAAAANTAATDAARKKSAKGKQRSAARSARTAPAAARPHSARRSRKPEGDKTASAPARRATAKAARAPSVSKRGALAVFANAPMPVAPQSMKPQSRKGNR